MHFANCATHAADFVHCFENLRFLSFDDAGIILSKNEPRVLIYKESIVFKPRVSI